MTKPQSPRKPRFVPAVHRLRPWYHDFSALGLRTVFDGWLGARPGAVVAALKETFSGRRIERGGRHPILDALRSTNSSHKANQLVKEATIRPLLTRALDRLDRPSCLDLFCSDGYYSCLLASLAPGGRVLGVDLDPMEIRRARTAAAAIGLHNAQFLVDEANLFLQQAGRFDLTLCMGGLYHLTQPLALLEAAQRASRGVLLVQSVVSLECESDDYYVTPAPNWRHGSRFSHARLAGWLEEAEWRILEADRNELPGNGPLCDRGSSYFLCETTGLSERTDKSIFTDSTSLDSG